ncbi:MAG: signal recognition particle protein [Rhodospirillaceae bacterium]|nr:signal recognition particle protein [Rhodospirillaceae bacterium]
MFDTLSGKLTNVFDKLTKRGALSEGDVNAAMREVRIALLEADVSLPVVKEFIEKVRTRSVGAEVVKSVTPGQQVIKIVNDEIINMLGKDEIGLNLSTSPPAVILMTGLQGSGKTTTTAKLGKLVKTTHKKKVLMASLDVHRPAAMEQLATLGQKGEIDTLPIKNGLSPIDIAKNAINTGRKEGYDVVILDTAGRLHVDDTLMSEIKGIQDIAKPTETLLVADSLTDQDAVNVATNFSNSLNLSGIVLTRIDGDGRGGAALSMRATTGCPIKFMGNGEGLDAIEAFHPDRIANRILGMGDVVSLVEKAQEAMDIKEAEKLAKKVKKGKGFDLNDMDTQLAQMRKMGGMDGLMGMLPGVNKVKKQLAQVNVDDKSIAHLQAIISSMTPAERANPKLLNGSRKRRIAGGSGTSVQEINRLLKQFKQMNLMMKRVGKLGEKGLARQGIQGLLPPMH